MLYNANKLELDLVLITETADPPVTKITDLAKYIYASKQKDKLAKRKQRESVVETKEIRLGINFKRPISRFQGDKGLFFIR